MGAPPQILLSTIGMWDSMFLMLLALVVFGPRRLPQIGRQIGKLMYEFRKASNDFKFQMEEELRVSEDADRRKKEEEERARQLALSPPVATQTIETPAAVGPTSTSSGEQPAGGGQAAEQASVSAEPASSYPAEAAAAEPTSPETAAAEPGNRIYPRISPPSTGETVAASRYGANGRVAETASEQQAAAETTGATSGGEPAPAPAAPPAAGSSSEPNRTETVSQNG
jgi:sec-independent protein translocase protein TatB